jgi:hypothetical protein
MVAMDLTLPVDGDDTLHRMLDVQVRECIRIAGLPALSQTIMKRLVVECCERTRCVVASRCDITLDLLDQLALDPSALVRLRVACNPRASRLSLYRLASDPESVVKAAADSALARPRTFAGMTDTGSGH